MINWDRVRSLRNEVGAEDFDEIVDLFFCEVEPAVSALADFETAEDLAARLHFLKSSALNLGFEDLSTLCARGEHAAESGQTYTINLDQVSSAYQMAKARFRAEKVDALGQSITPACKSCPP